MLKIKTISSILAVILVMGVGLSIIQCTPKPHVVKVDEETALRKRVQDYWDLRLTGKWDKSYLYESPEYREHLSIVSYINQNGRSPVKWEQVDILEVWTSGNEGHVKMNTKYRYLIPQTRKAAFDKVVEEQWVKIEGQWYRLPTKGS
jgi:hypothetical protein